MDRGIWAIWYDLPAEHQAEYLEWFHHVHIPDKLARPGYVWAAHYELEDDKGYLALFGGATDTRIGTAISTARPTTLPELLVGPEGSISVPFAGQVPAGGGCRLAR